MQSVLLYLGRTGRQNVHLASSMPEVQIDCMEYTARQEDFTWKDGKKTGGLIMTFLARLIRKYTPDRKAFAEEATRFRLRSEELDELGMSDYTIATRFRLTKADGRRFHKELSEFLNREFTKKEMKVFIAGISCRDRRFKREREKKVYT